MVGRFLGPALAAISILAGLFAIGAPAVAWLAFGLGMAALPQPGQTLAAVGTLAILGSQALAVLVVAAAPVGILAAVLALPLSRYHDRSMAPAVIGLLLNLAAPMTWVLTWAAVIGGLMWLLQDLQF